MAFEEFQENWQSHYDAIKKVLSTFKKEPAHDDERADTDFCQPIIPLSRSNAFRLQIRSTVFRLAIAFQISWFLESVIYSTKQPNVSALSKQTKEFQKAVQKFTRQG